MTRRSFLKLLGILLWVRPLGIPYTEEPPVAPEADGLVFPMKFPICFGMSRGPNTGRGENEVYLPLVIR